MANRVKISVIGHTVSPPDQGTGPAAVDAMIEFWSGKFQNVLPDGPDLVVVPECCDRYWHHDFDQVRAYYGARGDRVRDAFAGVAAENRCTITYPAERQMADGTWRNTVELIGPDGHTVGTYHKNHPTIGEMDQGIRAGRTAPVFDCAFGRVGCAICFDLNYAELRRQYAEQRPDLVLFSSVFHGGLMQPYWAYSCRAHMATAVMNHPSRVLSPVGHEIATTTNYHDFVTTAVNLDCCIAHLDFNREEMAALKHQHGKNVTMFDTGFLGSVLITSESEDLSALDMAREQGIELLDPYFDRSRAARAEHME